MTQPTNYGVCPSAAKFVLSMKHDDKWNIVSYKVNRDLMTSRKLTQQQADLLKVQNVHFSESFKIIVMGIIGKMKIQAFNELNAWTAMHIPTFTVGTGTHVVDFLQITYDNAMIKVNGIMQDNLLHKWEQEMKKEIFEDGAWVQASYSCMLHRTFHDHIRDCIKQAKDEYKSNIETAGNDFLLLDKDFLEKYNQIVKK